MKKNYLFLIILSFSVFILSGQTQTMQNSVYEVTVNVSSCCSANLSDSLNIITLESVDTDSVYQSSFDNYQSVTFESIPNGNYNLKVDVEGYKTYNEYSLSVEQNMNIDPIILIPTFPPVNIYLDTVTSMLSWDDPVFATLDERFNSSNFPPSWWNSESQGVGWQHSDDGGSEGFQIPYNGGLYTFVNNDNAEPGNNGCCDKLITKEVNLRYRDYFKLEFDSYFTAEGGQTAMVNYSTNGGQTWNLLAEMEAGTDWQPIEVDLSFLSGFEGEENVLFQFFTSDNNQNGSGWAIDNIIISAGYFNPEYYVLELGTEVYNIESDINTFYIPDLIYGSNYTYRLGAYACCALGSGSFNLFTSAYLPLPENLQVNFNENTNELNIEWNIPSFLESVPAGLTGFNLNMDGDNLSEIVYEGEAAGETISQTISEFSTGEHEFCITATYDLTEYGFPGITESSTQVCENVNVVYTQIPETDERGSLVKMYPNPATNQLTIESAENIETIYVVNQLGQTILEKSINAKQAKVNTAKLENGIYFVRVKTEKGILNKKVVIQN